MKNIALKMVPHLSTMLVVNHVTSRPFIPSPMGTRSSAITLVNRNKPSVSTMWNTPESTSMNILNWHPNRVMTAMTSGKISIE